jgi:hypothetical protein
MLGANPWELMTWMGHKRLEETQLYADVARAHGRSVPQTILAAGAKEADPNRRVLAQLSARLALPPKKSGSKVAADGSDREVATELLGSCLVTPRWHSSRWIGRAVQHGLQRPDRLHRAGRIHQRMGLPFSVHLEPA